MSASQSLGAGWLLLATIWCAVTLLLMASPLDPIFAIVTGALAFVDAAWGTFLLFRGKGHAK